MQLESVFEKIDKNKSSSENEYIRMVCDYILENKLVDYDENDSPMKTKHNDILLCSRIPFDKGIKYLCLENRLGGGFNFSKWEKISDNDNFKRVELWEMRASKIEKALKEFNQRLFEIIQESSN